MLWAKIKKGYKLGLKAAKTMKQRKEKRKKRNLLGDMWEIQSKHYPSQPWSMKGTMGMCGECVWGSHTVEICITCQSSVDFCRGYFTV